MQVADAAAPQRHAAWRRSLRLMSPWERRAAHRPGIAAASASRSQSVVSGMTVLLVCVAIILGSKKKLPLPQPAAWALLDFVNLMPPISIEYCGDPGCRRLLRCGRGDTRLAPPSLVRRLQDRSQGLTELGFQLLPGFHQSKQVSWGQRASCPLVEKYLGGRPPDRVGGPTLYRRPKARYTPGPARQNGRGGVHVSSESRAG